MINKTKNELAKDIVFSAFNLKSAYHYVSLRESICIRLLKRMDTYTNFVDIVWVISVIAVFQQAMDKLDKKSSMCLLIIISLQRKIMIKH